MIQFITKTCPCNIQRIFSAVKLKILLEKKLISNEYPQSMFLSKIRKNRYTPVYPSFFYIKVGFKGVYITRTCFPDEINNTNPDARLERKYRTGHHANVTSTHNELKWTTKQRKLNVQTLLLLIPSSLRNERGHIDNVY